MNSTRSLVSKTALIVSASVLSPLHAFAQFGSSLPWERPMDQIVDSLSGPVVRAVATIAIVVTGLAYAFGEAGSVFRKGAAVVFGISIAVGAGSLVSNLFG